MLRQLTAAALVLAGCGHQRPAERAELPVVPVKTVTVHLQRTPEIFEVVGTVRPVVSATVSAKVLANVETIAVKAGDVVTNGQLLARLDARELQAEYDRAKADFDRIKRLVEQEAVARADFDAVNARFRVAEAALSNTRVTAPFDGVIASKLCDIGDLAAPNKPLFLVERTDAYRLEARVPERYAAAGAVGKNVHVVIEATGEKCVGVIGESEPVADAASRSFLIKIDLQCRQPVKSGGFGRAQLLIGERPALFVTKDTVRQRGQLTYLYVAEAGKARLRLVKTGVEYLGAIEILAGLEPDETVITEATGELTDGSPIRIQ